MYTKARLKVADNKFKRLEYFTRLAGQYFVENVGREIGKVREQISRKMELPTQKHNKNVFCALKKWILVLNKSTHKSQFKLSFLKPNCPIHEAKYLLLSRLSSKPNQIHNIT